jgi:hypothetical protein
MTETLLKSGQNNVSIYIPRILGNITRAFIVSTFHNLDIGKVYYLDMHKKINDKKRVYYFAFLSVELYDSQSAQMMTRLLNKNGITKMVYDEESNHYWEIKKYVSRALRTPSPPQLDIPKMEEENQPSVENNPPCVDNNDTFTNVGSLPDKSIFKSISQYDGFDLVKEFENIQREIYELCILNYNNN